MQRSIWESITSKVQMYRYFLFIKISLHVSFFQVIRKPRRFLMHAVSDNRTFRRRSQNARRGTHVWLWVIEWLLTLTEDIDERRMHNDERPRDICMHRTYLLLRVIFTVNSLESELVARPALNCETFVCEWFLCRKRFAKFAVFFPSFSLITSLNHLARSIYVFEIANLFFIFLPISIELSLTFI